MSANSLPYLGSVLTSRQFENIQANPEAPNTKSPGTVNGLSINSFVVASAALQLTGTVPHTKPNELLTNSQFQSNGTPSFIVAPPYRSINFKNFWFGCNADLPEANADDAAKCTISVKGFNSAGTKVADESFIFEPPVPAVGTVPTIQAVLPATFAKVYKVTAVQDNPLLEVLFMDSLTYSVSK